MPDHFAANSFTAARRLSLPTLASSAFTAYVYVGSVPLLPGVGEEAKALRAAWEQSVESLDLIALGAEKVTAAPTPMVMEGWQELDVTLEPDEMDF